jgi:hypothetical protein
MEEDEARLVVKWEKVSMVFALPVEVLDEQSSCEHLWIGGEDGSLHNYNFCRYTEEGYCLSSPADQETRLFGPSFARSWASNVVAKLRNGEAMYFAKAKYMASGDTDMDNSRIFLLPMLTPACGNCSGAPTRTGAEVDGKFVYLYDIENNVKTNPPCLVYSFGSRNEFSFETFIHLQKNCEIHTFDCTVVDPQPPSFVTYHNWCLGFRGQQDPRLHTFDKIVALLGHQKREISLLKIDIEGWSGISSLNIYPLLNQDPFSPSNRFHLNYMLVTGTF